MRADEVTWDTTDDAPPRDAAAIDQGLDSFNRAAADFAGVRRLACFARSPHHGLIGGAIARTWGRCCELQQVWVAEPHRRRGIGRRLVQLVEEEARRRGCTLIYLETFSFQAPSLYRALGFESACELAGFPDGVVKYLMRKALACPRCGCDLSATPGRCPECGAVPGEPTEGLPAADSAR